jgi:hypothetical protein
MKIATAPDDLTNAYQDVQTLNCSWNCEGSTCYGTQTKYTLYKDYTRTIIVTWGTADSTSDHFTPVATFTGAFAYETNDWNTTACQ